MEVAVGVSDGEGASVWVLILVGVGRTAGVASAVGVDAGVSVGTAIGEGGASGARPQQAVKRMVSYRARAKNRIGTRRFIHIHLNPGFITFIKVHTRQCGQEVNPIWGITELNDNVGFEKIFCFQSRGTETEWVKRKYDGVCIFAVKTHPEVNVFCIARVSVKGYCIPPTTRYRTWLSFNDWINSLKSWFSMVFPLVILLPDLF